METEEQKTCPNCKREIPAVNFTIHSVHCARNIKMCPVCKEPVPLADLDDHHEKLHKLLPCNKCGEKVCGTDLEDHIRDSCGHTIKPCRFCLLELPRRELPAHESYCGVRTEQCADCREYVMLKYRQLHLDSNHGFLRLDDDPVPKKDPPKTTNLPKATNLPKPTNLPSTSNGFGPTASYTKNTNLVQSPRTEIRYFGSSNGPSTSGSGQSAVNLSKVQNKPNVSRNESNVSRPGSSVSRPENSVSRPENNVSRPENSVSRPQSSVQNVYNGIGGSKAPLKRTNDQPQINTAVTATNKINKEPISRGAVKKRPAPKPPTRAPPTVDPKRELAYHSALLRSQEEERKRQEQNAYNLAHGLPPVLTSAAKLEKLRKMDALQNREFEDNDYKNRLQGRVWMNHFDVPIGNVLGSVNHGLANSHLEVDRRRDNRLQGRQSPDFGDQRDDFKDLKPMTPQEFMDRFKELQLRKQMEDRGERAPDRFSEIKSSLRELRRGLNEVTAPYNSNVANNNERARRSPRVSPVPADDEVHLPCEFCGVPVVAADLVQHQTGCRPDLAQYRAEGGGVSPRARASPLPRARASPLPRARASPPPLPHPDPHDVPVIPCEFCTESLPVYLISEHQERCGRDSNMLYPD